jgi:hypothetical protein
MPNIKARGIEQIISSPPRAAIGLPHPGRRQIRITNVAMGIAINIDAILPNRILNLSKNAEKPSASFNIYYIGLSAPVSIKYWQTYYFGFFRYRVWPTARVTPMRSK